MYECRDGKEHNKYRIDADRRFESVFRPDGVLVVGVALGFRHGCRFVEKGIRESNKDRAPESQIREEGDKSPHSRGGSRCLTGAARDGIRARKDVGREMGRMARVENRCTKVDEVRQKLIPSCPGSVDGTFLVLFIQKSRLNALTHLFFFTSRQSSRTIRMDSNGAHPIKTS